MSESDEIEYENTTEYTGGVVANAWLPFSLSVKKTMTRRWRERTEEFGEDVRAISGLTSEQIAERAEANEALDEMLLDSIEKASRTSDRQFRSSLARLVTGGLTDDAKVDEIAYLVSILKQLEPVHLRVLGGFASVVREQIARFGPSTPERVTDLAGVEQVAVFLRVEEYLIASCAERLMGFSLLTDTYEGSLIYRTAEPGENPLIYAAYGTTEMGRRLLAHSLGLLNETPPTDLDPDAMPREQHGPSADNA